MAESVRRRPLQKDLGVGEMLRLREEQGMTNHDIAKMLEVSYATVHRYIGKQPPGLERLSAFADKSEQLGEVCQTKPKGERAERAILTINGETVSCGGLTADIDYGLEEVCIYADHNSCLMLEISSIPDLLTFLLELSGRVQRQGDKNE